jgi:hypothetical protein
MSGFIDRAFLGTYVAKASSAVFLLYFALFAMVPH